MDQQLTALAFLRRLDLPELIEFLSKVYNGERIIVASYVFDVFDKGANPVWYEVYIAPDGTYRVDADWGDDGPVWVSEEEPTAAWVEQFHQAWLMTKEEIEEYLDSEIA